MKKVYSAPDIAFESFSMSVSIASDCTAETNWGKDSCGYKFDGETYIFLETVAACTDKIVDGDPDYNGICYHNFSSDKQLFGS